RVGDVGAGRAVVILDQRVDLKAFDTRQFGTGVIRHRVAVTGGVLISAVEIAEVGRPRRPHAPVARITALAATATKSPVRVCRAAAPTPLVPSVSTRTGVNRFSIWIFSRILRCRSTRYSAF